MSLQVVMTQLHGMGVESYIGGMDFDLGPLTVGSPTLWASFRGCGSSKASYQFVISVLLWPGCNYAVQVTPNIAMLTWGHKASTKLAYVAWDFRSKAEY